MDRAEERRVQTKGISELCVRFLAEFRTKNSQSRPAGSAGTQKTFGVSGRYKIFKAKPEGLMGDMPLEWRLNRSERRLVFDLFFN